MRFQGLDLNLLVVLNALFDTQSVTKAGEQLHLSQPATSSALARLRAHFDDDLVIPRRNTQGIKEMVPTPFGATLAEPVRRVLGEIQATVNRQAHFDVATCTQHIRLIAPDYIEITLLEPVIRHASKAAPSMTFEVSTEGSADYARTELRRGTADFVILRPDNLESGHPSRPLLRDRSVAIGCASNQALVEGMAQEDFLALRRIELGKMHSERIPCDKLEDMRLFRSDSFHLKIDNLTTLPAYLMGSEMAGIVPRLLAAQFCRIWPLKFVEVAGLDQPVDFALQWNRVFEGDPAKMWFRDLLLDKALELAERSGG